MTRRINRERWLELLQSGLPGEKAHRIMAPSVRGQLITGSRPVPAAVMVLFYPSGKDTSLVFIRRNEYPGHHSAQVSFPGGRMEPSDRSLQETALRETMEELGVESPIEVLGRLTDLHIPVSNFIVSPFLGWINHTPRFDPDGTEVQYIIEAPLSMLLDPTCRGRETLHRDEILIKAPFYRVGKDKIWGATAMILSEVLQLASTV